MRTENEIFDIVGEAILASILAISFLFICVVMMTRRSNGWILVFPFAYAFTAWSIRSWKSLRKTED